MTGKPERLETARLILRRPVMTDVDAIYQGWAGDPDVTKYLGWLTHTSRAATEDFVRQSDAEWETWPAGPLLIESRASGVLVGSTGYGFETTVESEVGYVLARPYWGRGFATEALAALVDLAPNLGLQRLHAWCHPRNLASLRVLEKCGFVRDIDPLGTAVFPNLEPEPGLTGVSLWLDVERKADP